jgi:hypothetical protein
MLVWAGIPRATHSTVDERNVLGRVAAGMRHAVRVRLVRSDKAADRLREMVAEAGIDVEHLRHEDVGRAWGVIRRFALERAEDVDAVPGDYDDGLLAQYGVYDWTFTGDDEFFALDMTRQFAVPAPGQPDLRQVLLHLQVHADG